MRRARVVNKCKRDTDLEDFDTTTKMTVTTRKIATATAIVPATMATYGELSLSIMTFVFSSLIAVVTASIVTPSFYGHGHSTQTIIKPNLSRPTSPRSFSALTMKPTT